MINIITLSIYREFWVIPNNLYKANRFTLSKTEI